MDFHDGYEQLHLREFGTLSIYFRCYELYHNWWYWIHRYPSDKSAERDASGSQGVESGHREAWDSESRSEEL